MICSRLIRFLKRNINSNSKQRLELQKSSRTARLWLQYLDMVAIVRAFIRSERTGNWELHLSSLRDMLPHLAAAGHHLYTKSIYIYLQQLSYMKLIQKFTRYSRKGYMSFEDQIDCVLACQLTSSLSRSS